MLGKEVDLFGNVIENDPILRDKFIEPPFTIIDTKTGSWRKRKKLWMQLGIKSEVGRPGMKTCNPKVQGTFAGKKMNLTAVSVFDPALCEVLYYWFCPPGGTILDPFAGGSVRGIVANKLGYKYTGIDIRQEQIDSNREQALDILAVDNQPNWYVGDSNALLTEWLSNAENNQAQTAPQTPIQYIPEIDIWIKREDLFMVCGACGAKARTAHSLVNKAISKGFKALSTAGSRKSPQINIVAKIAKYYNLAFVAHAPEGQLGEELLAAKESGAKIIQHKAGYNSVIKARAKTWAEENNGFEIPFGMMSDAAIKETAGQVNDIPAGVKRIVIPVGSGMNLAGLLRGLKDKNLSIPVLGVRVGAAVEDTLDKFAPSDWRDMVELVNAGMDYHEEEKDNIIYNTAASEVIELDPIYEAKCKRFLRAGDLFWVVGKRGTLATNQPAFNYFEKEKQPQLKNPVQEYDFIFSCPPYADLEVYSELEADISNMPYNKFLDFYEQIITKASKLLKPGGYACFVVGEVRDKNGHYLGFVPDTIKAFEKAGLKYYNEAILATMLGTAMMRASNSMKNKKLVKVHQNVLVFVKP